MRNDTLLYTAAVNGTLRGPAAYTSLIRISEKTALLVYDAYLQQVGAFTFSMEVTTSGREYQLP